MHPKAASAAGRWAWRQRREKGDEAPAGPAATAVAAAKPVKPEPVKPKMPAEEVIPATWCFLKKGKFLEIFVGDINDARLV